jgi:hypothetical protein
MKENNKLIAEFMGTEWHKDFFKDVCIISPSNISYKFHTSWDWLMPVVMKISRKTDKPLDEVVSLLTEVGSDNIWDAKSLHNAVLEFIKNQNN